MKVGSIKYQYLKRLSLLQVLLFISVFNPTFAQHSNCRLLITSDINDIDGRNYPSGIHPGDTICLLSGEKSYLSLKYIQGTKEAPIVICNVDGLVKISGYYFGLRIDSCSFLKFTGSGYDNLEYGIQILNVAGAGISVEGLSTDIEIERLEVGYTQLVGLFAKSDPDCDFKSVRGKYTLRNLLIHDNYFHHTGMEGMYIGSSFYDGIILNCGGKDTLVFPHMLKGVKVYNNIVKHTGWDGIQVSCSDSSSVISNNSIQNDSDSTVLYQMSGILLGGGSVCDCYNNIIQNGKGDGIDIFSQADQKIFNNLIINPGRTYHPDENFYPYQKHGIYVGNNITAPNEGYTICYNTIISPKSTGIKFTNLNSKKNSIINNLIINPGSYQTIGQEAFVNVSETSIDVTVINNYLNTDFGPAKFVDPSSYNFDLEPTSPAVNKALSIGGFPLEFDIQNRSRPFSWQNDIGAFECHDSSLIGIPELLSKEITFYSVFPNPAAENIIIVYSIEKKTNLKIGIYDITGKMMIEAVNSNHLPGLYEKKLSVFMLKPGIYSLVLQTDQTIINRKVLVLTQ